jgi:hypothetical protein
MVLQIVIDLFFRPYYLIQYLVDCPCNISFKYSVYLKKMPA